MKTKGLFGIVAVLVLIASFVIPGNLATPSPVSADPGKMEWTPVNTPDTLLNQINSLFTPAAGGVELGSEIIKLLVGNDGQTMYALVRVGHYVTSATPDGQLVIFKSMNGGVTWMGSPNVAGNAAAGPGLSAVHQFLERDMGLGAATVYDIAIAPDDPNIVVVAVTPTSPAVGVFGYLQEVWISVDGGSFWENTNWPGASGAVSGADIISALDVSMSYGQGRYLLVGTRDGAAAGVASLQTMRVPGYGGWAGHDVTGVANGADVFAAKFSPTFIGDATIAVVYQDGTLNGTYLVTGALDIFANIGTWPTGGTAPIEVASITGGSPAVGVLWTADLEMPSDFSGQTASLRRFYVSTAADTGVGINHGIYRIDDNVVYPLMDNTNVPWKKIYSIAYWGTYASGKLMAGEIFGYSCTATVPVWFTDSPTVCPVPCWYPAKKAPTGAAGCTCVGVNDRGYGNAWVVWSPTYADQGVAYTVTSSTPLGPIFSILGAHPVNSGNCLLAEPVGYLWPDSLIDDPIALDESAFSLTRNNGATWNQLSLIDTRMSKLTDVAPSKDCTTIFLASSNDGALTCNSFDSVWRSSSNEAVVAPPLPASPVGTIWERVLTHVTAPTCQDAQSEYAILRLAPDKLDGQVVGWAAGGTSGLATIEKDDGAAVVFPVGANTQAVMWSPDFGDFWGSITPRMAVQDMEFSDSTTLNVIGGGTFQKLPYTGTAWSSASPTVQLNVGGAGGHTIDVNGAGMIAVASAAGNSYTMGFSPSAGDFFIPFTQPTPDSPDIGYHAIIDTDFATNATVYLASDASATGGGGVVRRNTAPAGASTPWTNMSGVWTNAFWWTNHRAYFGMAQTNSLNVSGQGTLYAAHRPGLGRVAVAGNTIPQDAGGDVTRWSGVERTLRPLDGIPKPGIEWSCLDASDAIFRAQGAAVTSSAVWFTLEPKSLKICGCLTQETDTTLYAIDNDWYANNHNIASALVVPNVRGRGMLWAYTDCVAKVGPVLTMDDGTIIGCDPATGRNQEVNFTWEQLCISNWYQFLLSKTQDPSQTILTGGVSPLMVTSPALIILAGGEGAVPDITLLNAASPFAQRVPSLECGHTYYWMVRTIDVVTREGSSGLAGFNTLQSNWGVNSPWSAVRSFIIKAGFRVTTPYYGVQLLSPDNGCGCPCAAPLCFSWSPFKETTAYKFELSENADMSSPLVSTTVSNATAYQYTGAIKCNTNYFWRVMSTAPAPSEWSATFSFMTQAEPPPPPAAPEAPATPIWVWVVIAIGAILVIVTLVLIFKTRRV